MTIPYLQPEGPIGDLVTGKIIGIDNQEQAHKQAQIKRGALLINPHACKIDNTLLRKFSFAQAWDLLEEPTIGIRPIRSENIPRSKQICYTISRADLSYYLDMRCQPAKSTKEFSFYRTFDTTAQKHVFIPRTGKVSPDFYTSFIRRLRARKLPCEIFRLTSLLFNEQLDYREINIIWQFKNPSKKDGVRLGITICPDTKDTGTD